MGAKILNSFPFHIKTSGNLKTLQDIIYQTLLKIGMVLHVSQTICF